MAVSAPAIGAARQVPVHITTIRRMSRIMRASVLCRNHAGRGGVCVPIGFLPVDAPVAQGLDRDFPAGDSADNIKGVAGLGPVKSDKLLRGKTEIEMYDICVDKLGSEERAIENGILLYLRRQDDEIWQPPRPVTTDDGQKLDTSLS